MRRIIELVSIFIFLLVSAVLYGEEWIPLDVSFHNVLELSPTGDILESGYGRVAISYTPEPSGFFVNVVALDSDFSPVWIVRNLYLPDRSWIPHDQTISSRFPLSILTPDSDRSSSFDFTYVVYGIFRSPYTVGSMPDLSMLHETVVGTLIDDSGEGVVFDEDLFPPLDELPPFPGFEDGDSIEELEFRGCRVPNIDLDSASHPPTVDYAGDRNACGVASTANSFMWMKDVFPEIDFEQSHRELLELLSGLMGRAPASGVTATQMIRGKLDLIEMLGLNIQVKFQSEFHDTNVRSSTGASIAQNRNTGSYPTWGWLQAELADSEDVELNYRWIDVEGNDRGHSVVVTGAEIGSDGVRRIKFKHDTNQRGESDDSQLEHADEKIYLDDYGRMRLPGRHNAVISSVISESPGEPFVGIGDAGKLPEKFAVSAFPNPFNSSVRIAIESVGAVNELPLQSISVEIFDISGHMVDVIAISKGEAISPSRGDCCIWQPSASLPSGVFLLRARMGNSSAVKRIVYLK